ncbi:MAG: sugar phosphate isomerase/epimerase family protein [Nanoarchaeota archaeon]
MKLSVSIWSVFEKVEANQMDNLSFIEFCKQEEVKYVELLDLYLEKNNIDDINSLLKNYNMGVSSFSVTNDFVDPNKEKRKIEVEKLKESIDVANFLKAKYVRVFSGNKKDGVEYEQARLWIVECFKELVPYAKSRGVTMVIENHGLFVGKSFQVKELLNDIDSEFMKANVDVGNFLLANENPYNAVNNLEDYIAFVHLKDMKSVEKDAEGLIALDGSKYEGTLLGKGEVPLIKIINYLSKIKYNGFMSIEFEGKGDPLKGTRESINYIKSIIKGI